MPQYMALCVSFVSCVNKKFVVSVRWVTLWVRPPPVKIGVSVRWVTLWVRPPLCVRSIGNTVGSPPSVSFHWKTNFVRSLLAAYSALRHFFFETFNCETI